MLRPSHGVIAAALVLVLVALGYFFLPTAPRPPGQQPGGTSERTEPDTDTNAVPPLDVIALAAIRGEAGGEANRKFESGSFTLAVRAEGLAALAPGMFYAGWLFPSPAAASGAIYLGPMRLLESGDYQGDYVLGYLADRDLRAYKTVMISREKTDDQKPEEQVLSGSFP